MRFLWTGYLSARHDFWPRALSVGNLPTVTTYKANTGRTPRFLRFHRTCGQVRRWSVGHDAPGHLRRGKSPARRPQSAGRGAYAMRAFWIPVNQSNGAPYVASMSRGAAGSFGQPLKSLGNKMQHTRHAGGGRISVNH